MANYKIRKANPEDARSIATVQLQSWRETYTGMGIDQFLSEQTVDMRSSAWQENLDPKRYINITFIVEVLGEIVAFCSAGNSRVKAYQNWGEIYALYCLKEKQGQGFGRELMQTQARHFQELGYKQVFVRTMQRGPAKFFYQHLGGRELLKDKVNFGGVEHADVTYGWARIEDLANHKLHLPKDW